MTFTPGRLREMDANEIAEALEAKLGHRLPVEFVLRLALLQGLRGKPLVVIDPSPFAKVARHEESIDYDALAKLLNEGER